MSIFIKDKLLKEILMIEKDNDYIQNKKILYNNLKKCFSSDELKSLNIELNCTLDLYGKGPEFDRRSGKLEIVNELFEFHERNGTIEQLKGICKQERPNVDWEVQSSKNFSVEEAEPSSKFALADDDDDKKKIQQPRLQTFSRKHLKFIKDNIFDIRCYNAKNEVDNYGTGFFISKNLLLTCHHCVFDRKNGEFYWNIQIITREIDSKQENAGYKQAAAVPINFLCSHEKDYAVLFTDLLQHKFFNLADNDNLDDIPINTAMCSYGFSEIIQGHSRRNKTTIKGNLFAEEEYPQGGISNALTFEVDNKTSIYDGQSGSPICILQENADPLVIAILQGDILSCKYNDGREWKKIYGLPIEEVSFKFKTIQTLRDEINFVSVPLYSLSDVPEKTFCISKKPFTYEDLNKLLDMNLKGFNYFEASTFANIIGDRLPTAKEWLDAERKSKIRVNKSTKEWLDSVKENAETTHFIMDADYRVQMEHRPNESSPHYAFRIVLENREDMDGKD